MDIANTDGLMGFAIQREDLTNDERVWLRGQKHFPELQSDHAFDSVSSVEAPFQTYQWADYSAKPKHEYIYRIFPMSGNPGELTKDAKTEVHITTESLQGTTHSIHFNRAAIASQAYARRFFQLPPETVGDAAFHWLARDLLPSLLAFIARAQPGWKIRAAIFETRFTPVLEALQAAHRRGVDVKLIYAAEPDSDTTVENENALHEVLDPDEFDDIVVPRGSSKLMHNKFIVLENSSEAISVWTGSTNLSNNAFYGQLNVGHVIENTALAVQYLELWELLALDPDKAGTKDWIEENNPIPPSEPLPTLFPIWSPHRGNSVFNWYMNQARSATEAMFVTCPFGIVKDFRPIFLQDDNILRYVLLEKFVNGGTSASRAAAIEEIQNARKRPNVTMAKGSRIFSNRIDGWLRESHGLGTWVNWVHTKFMLLDPLGPDPITITGSANWSPNSVSVNDENMIFIRGDERVAHIYLTEFMRIFSHHAFRESLG